MCYSICGQNIYGLLGKNEQIKILRNYNDLKWKVSRKRILEKVTDWENNSSIADAFHLVMFQQTQLQRT